MKIAYVAIGVVALLAFIAFGLIVHEIGAFADDVRGDDT